MAGQDTVVVLRALRGTPLDCGCVIDWNEDAASLTRCSTHKAAPAMLKALEVLRSGRAQQQLAFLHERGLKAPETRYGDAQRPETYQITNDYEMDADGVYPACDSLARAVAVAAIAQARGQELRVA